LELRRASRITVDLPARCRSDVLDLSIEGRATNLSQDGMLLTLVGGALGVGGSAFVELDLPDENNRPLRAIGEICWNTAAGAGIRFLEIPLADFRRLANFVLRRVNIFE
jgi:hypothetical protein